jgi:hypothetical protein
MALGKADRRHVTRIFFPGLYKKGQSPGITADLRAFIYEKGLRPAAIEVNPLDQSRWPITYSALMTLYRDVRGQFHFGTIDFPARLLHKLATKLLEKLETRDELRGAFFVHELRGTKGGSIHDPGSDEERRAAVAGVFHIFDRNMLNEEDWVVDVALEVRHEGHVLQWLTKGHRCILEFILKSASAEQISSVLSSQTQYHLDLSAQLGDLGGFRALPSSRGAADSVSYINVYTTDKSATYQLHEGVFRRRKAWHLFPDNIGSLLKDLTRIASSFQACAGDATLPGLEANARLEIRVPLRLADKVLVHLPDPLIQQSLAMFDCPTFW